MDATPDAERPGASGACLRRQATADGMLDSSVVILLNRLQKPGARASRLMWARQERTIARALDGLEQKQPTSATALTSAISPWLPRWIFLTWPRSRRGRRASQTRWLVGSWHNVLVARTDPTPP